MSTAQAMDIDESSILDISDPSCLLPVIDCEDTAVAIMDRIAWERLVKMRDKFAEALSYAEDHSLVSSIKNIYQKLPPPFQARLLMSMEFGEWTSRFDYWRDTKKTSEYDTESDKASYFLSALFEIVTRELSLYRLEVLGEVDDHLLFCRAGSLWSALGDINAKRNSSGSWEILKTSCIGGGISVDFDSPFAQFFEARSGVLSQKMMAHSDDEKQLVVEKLERALTMIDKVEPIYGVFIRNFVRRVIVRKSVQSLDPLNPIPSEYASEHVPRQPGGIRLLNFHLPEVGLSTCMETLLHEATHNFLAAWECIFESFTSKNQDYRPISFWSGRAIPNSSFMHAIFVYFGCHRLFTLHRESLVADGFHSGDPEFDNVERRLKTFAAGFLLDQNLGDQFLQSGKSISKQLIDVVTGMQLCMKEFYGLQTADARGY
ncbi:hypothetical protein [Dyella caseinilytica]|uniref:HEXXH motif-containing protein n=1 Tax=Dyella caseinilytica TaxID=1849581 RepID=A0ABX7GWW0_9GAMM|nr:hypothetical protein [Dyella caseinilytica]QRN54902.1 hypothetical protein ISN74_06000 [Dyella caseinilytica]